MDDTRLANEDFIGFAALRSARERGDGTALRVRSTGSAAETETSTLVAVDENFLAEEVRFDGLSGENRRKSHKKISTNTGRSRSSPS